MDIQVKKALYDHLSEFVTENKKRKFDEIVMNRTRYITVVLEDVFQPHNASAVLRTCDCFGIQDVHIIENQYEYLVNPEIALGASKWLNLVHYGGKENNTPDAIKGLKDSGYRIVATSPHHNDVNLGELSLDKGPLALVFGTEKKGLTGKALDLADEFVKIPMFGFTESFNISVSAAIVLFSLTQRLHQQSFRWQLSEEEMIDTKIQWAKQVVKSCDLLERNFLKRYFL